MAGDTPTACGHGRDLCGRVHGLTAGSMASQPASIELPTESTSTTRITGSVLLSSTGLSSDPPAAVNVHDATDKAISVYPWEHYASWAEELGAALGDFAFGENLTSTGLLESEVFIGDVFEWGQATVQVSRPRRLRRPRLKVGPPEAQNGQTEVVQRTGFYLRVLRAGRVSPEDVLRLTEVDPFALSLADLNTVLTAGPVAAGLSLERVLLARHLLPTRWVVKLEKLRGVRTVSNEAPDDRLERLGGTAG